MNRAAVLRVAAATFLVLFVCPPGRADWLADIGYPQLSAELGASMPTGAGIIVLQTEAGKGAPQASATSPFAGAGIYSGKTFTMDSIGMVYSDHANSVAAYFYGNSTSASPGVTDVHLMDANGFVDTYETTSTPPVAAGLVHNHSWIGSSSSDGVHEQLLPARLRLPDQPGRNRFLHSAEQWQRDGGAAPDGQLLSIPSASDCATASTAGAAPRRTATVA